MNTSTPNPEFANSPSPWWRNEDWLAVVAAAAIIATAVLGWTFRLPALSWSAPSDLIKVASPPNLLAIAEISAALLLLTSIVLAPSLRTQTLPALFGTAVVMMLAWLAQILAANAVIKPWGIEYVVFALGLGLLWRHFLPRPAWIVAGVKTEYWIKIGIIVLGTSILFDELLTAGLPGLIQAILVIPVIWHVTFRIARWMKVDDEFAVMLSTAVSICGVSAAIAACGAIQGDKKKLSYTTSIVLLCAVPMMLVMPSAVAWLGLTEAVGGAWLGGTLDTSGSVLAATEMIGETASKVGTVVKLSQNVLIGIAAFLISGWWALRDQKQNPDMPRPTTAVIWERFPKFVIGFVLASVVFSFLLDRPVVKTLDKPLKGLREFCFAIAFVSIGLETHLLDICKLGSGRPAAAFLCGQVLNVFWTLLLAWFLFSSFELV